MTLRLKTFLPLGVLSALFLVFLYGYYSPQAIADIEVQEGRATQRHLDSIAQSLVPLLLARELDAVHENLDALRTLNEDWTYLRLTDPAGRQLYPLSGGPPQPELERDALALEHELRFRNQPLGSLALTVDLSSYIAAARARHRQLATALLLVLCGYLASIWWIVERVVRRPVGTLARAAEQVARGDFSAPLMRSGDDEVGALVDAFARMRSSIQGSEASLLESNRAVTALNRDLADANQLLEQRVAERTEELAQANRQLQEMAHTDSMLGINNRRTFDESLDREWRRAIRERTSLALLMIDVDHFKLYNDGCGHQAGDDCLRAIAGACAAALRRPADLVARYGGEELAVMLPSTAIEGARVVARTILGAIERLAIQHPSSPVAAYVTVSIGAAALVPERGSSPGPLVAAADQALYSAKAAGRNRVHG